MTKISLHTPKLRVGGILECELNCITGNFSDHEMLNDQAVAVILRNIDENVIHSLKKHVACQNKTPLNGTYWKINLSHLFFFFFFFFFLGLA